MPFHKYLRYLLFPLLCCAMLQAQELPVPTEDPAARQQLSLDVHVNTTSVETAPVLSSDGKALYFVREGHTNNIGEADLADIWVSYLQEDGGWSHAIHLPAPINTRKANHVIAIELTGEQMYLEDTYNDGQAYGIALSSRRGRSWSRPQNMQIEGFKANQSTRYQVDATGRFLLIMSAQSGGLGKRDLYICFRKDRLLWAAPISLGATINTDDDEAAAFLAADLRTLYFASDGRGGYGGLDWFYTKRQDDSWTRWSEPQQLGKTINTAEDDDGMTISPWGETGIIARKNDLEFVTLPENLRPEAMTLVSGNVVDARTRNPVNVAVSYHPYAMANEAATPLKVTQDGQFCLLTPSGMPGGYVCKEGYFATSDYRYTQKAALLEEDIDPYGATVTANLNPLYYQREKEIETLRLRLSQVDIELQEANRQRAVWKQKLEAASQVAVTNWKPETDPALRTLKSRYEEYLLRLNDTIVKPLPVLTPPKKDEAESEESVIPAYFDNVGRDEDESSELKRRLRNHYRPEPEEVSVEKGKYLWEDEPPVFEELSKNIRDSLRQELLPEVQQQLSRELVAEVLADLARDPNAIPEQEAALRDHIRQALSSSVMSHGALPKPSEPAYENEWERQLTADIKKALSNDVRAELAKTIRPDVKGALQTEATVLLKREQASTLRKALGAQIVQQIREEEKKMADLSETTLPTRPPREVEEPIVASPQLQMDIILRPIEEGQSILLNNVFFEANSARLKAASYAELNNVLEMLEHNPKMVIEIGAHTNGGLSHALAMQLSSQRAAAIANYLIGKGIPKENVPYRGYGKMIPIALNNTPEGRKENQRIELNILKLK